MLIQTKKTLLVSLIFCVFIGTQIFAQQTKGTVRIESSAKIDQIVAQKKQYNKNLKTYKGYRIQLFYGSEKGSYDIRNEFKVLFSEIPTKIVFSSPEWKVQVGNYKSRLEADRALVDIKKEFPSAIILATKIGLKK